MFCLGATRLCSPSRKLVPRQTKQCSNNGKSLEICVNLINSKILILSLVGCTRKQQKHLPLGHLPLDSLCKYFDQQVLCLVLELFITNKNRHLLAFPLYPLTFNR